MQCLQSMSKEIARQMETFQEGYIHSGLRDLWVGLCVGMKCLGCSDSAFKITIQCYH